MILQYNSPYEMTQVLLLATRVLKMIASLTVQIIITHILLTHTAIKNLKYKIIPIKRGV